MTEEQLNLLDVAPENAKEIEALAKKYKAVQSKRIKHLEAEKQLKAQLLELVEEAKLQRLEDGRIKFTVDDLLIIVTPRDELIQVKEAKPEE